MHGRPRQPKGVPENPDKLQATQKRVSDQLRTIDPKTVSQACLVTQIALYSRLATEVLNRRAAKQYDQESLKLAGKLLEQNPELYTIWNYRREALQSKLQVRQAITVCAAANKHHALQNNVAICLLLHLIHNFTVIVTSCGVPASLLLCGNALLAYMQLPMHAGLRWP